jgi:hypothetical protein
MKQISALIKTLSGERAKIINEKIAGAGSMHPLIEAWKTEEGRKKIIAIAQKRQNVVKDEVERLSQMDALRCEIFGLDKESIVY